LLDAALTATTGELVATTRGTYQIRTSARYSESAPA
jgi:hypothetical protein